MITAQNQLFDLTHLGLINIVGASAKTFLQGQLTCHLDEITENQSRLGAHCNPQGRVISFFHVFIRNDSYYLQMPRELIPLATRALQKYAVFFKVILNDVSDQFKQLGYIGEELIDMPHHPYEQFEKDHSIIIRMPGTPARYQLIGEPHTLMQWYEKGVLENLTYWKSIDIQHNLPAIYPETSEQFLPHQLGLPQLNAVSFNKGCYTGQEIIARMQYRGKLKNHLYRARVATPLQLIRGADIYLKNSSSGHIVDFCKLNDTHYELLVIAEENNVRTNQLSIDPEEKYILEFLE